MAARTTASGWFASATMLAALAAMFLLHLSSMTFADPDMWHEMALAREAVAEGWVPDEDHFAFTPTVAPSVHHEWGTGLLLYAVYSSIGPGGIMALKYALAAGVMAISISTAIRRGASLPLVALAAPLAIAAGTLGFSTLRAQVFTLLFLSVLLACFESDRRGGRAWIAWCLPLFVVWLNLHAGFVLGLVLLTAHAVEMFLRRRPWRHLLVVIGLVPALVAVNPFGLAYYPYLAHALAMDRNQISEWWPLWRTEPQLFCLYLASLLLVAYCAQKLGWRRMEGLLIVLLSAYAACRHTRHLSIFVVVWLAYVPGYLQQTALGTLAAELWQRRRRAALAVAGLLALVCTSRALALEPWRLRLPASAADGRAGLPVYPTGAVAWLREHGFRGKLLTPFTAGGYCIWQLYPGAKVSLDGRYEVAYQPGVFEDHVTLYEARPGWQDILRRYACDMLLVPVGSPLSGVLCADAHWTRRYTDAGYELYMPAAGRPVSR